MVTADVLAPFPLGLQPFRSPTLRSALKLHVGFDPAAPEDSTAIVLCLIPMTDNRAIFDSEIVEPGPEHTEVERFTAARNKLLWRHQGITAQYETVFGVVTAAQLNAEESGEERPTTFTPEQAALLLMRPEILDLAERMERKMQKHDGDRGDSFRVMPLDTCSAFIEGEMKELWREFRLLRAAQKKDPETRAAIRVALLAEIADVANGLMFLAQNVMREAALDHEAPAVSAPDA
jgi:hypothetical protein